MSIILLPQAVKIMIPAIISQCVVALKDTSLGYIIVAPGLTTRCGKAINIEFANLDTTIRVLAVFDADPSTSCSTGIATWVQRKFVGEKKLDVGRPREPQAAAWPPARTPAR